MVSRRQVGADGADGGRGIDSRGKRGAYSVMARAVAGSWVSVPGSRLTTCRKAAGQGKVDLQSPSSAGSCLITRMHATGSAHALDVRAMVGVA